MLGNWKSLSSREGVLAALALLLFLAIPSLAQAGENGPTSVDSREQEYSAINQLISSLEDEGNLLRRLVHLVRPSVVHIQASKLEGQDQAIVDETGSGVIIVLNNRHYILTNRHVINGAATDNIHIELADRRILKPTQAWSDPESDIAIMAIEADSLDSVKRGNSDAVQIGDFVLAVGSPFGLSHSVSYGIISAKGRRNLDLGSEDIRYQDFMQTDASINPGNSGGPLFNLRGELVGINTAIASATGRNEGIGFSIPINMVMHVAEQLVENGSVQRAYLGVHLDSQFDSEKATQLGLRRMRGACVSGINPSSPAASADFRLNDVITQFNGIPIEDDNHLINVVSVAPVGEWIEVEIIRAGVPSIIEVQVADRSQF